MGLNDVRPTSKRKTVLFFLLDASNSMNDVVGDGRGAKIDGLNKAVSDALNMAKVVESNDVDNRFEVAILAFGTGSDGMGCEWITKEPIPLKRFEYEPISASGWTPIANAVDQLNEKMSREKFLDSPSMSGLPIVILITDGVPCTAGHTTEEDRNATLDAIDRLHKNSWFEHGFKAAIKMGDDAESDVYAKFTGSESTVFDTDCTAKLKEVIKFVIASSTLIGKTIMKDTGEENDVPEARPRSVQERQEEESEKLKETLEEDDGGNFDPNDWGDD